MPKSINSVIDFAALRWFTFKLTFLESEFKVKINISGFYSLVS